MHPRICGKMGQLFHLINGRKVVKPKLLFTMVCFDVLYKEVCSNMKKI